MRRPTVAGMAAGALVTAVAGGAGDSGMPPQVAGMAAGVRTA